MIGKRIEKSYDNLQPFLGSKWLREHACTKLLEPYATEAVHTEACSGYPQLPAAFDYVTIRFIYLPFSLTLPYFG